MPSWRRRRCWASASRSMIATAKALRGGSLNGDGYVGWIPDAALVQACGCADAQGHGAADVRVPGPVDQAAAGRNAADGRARSRSRAKTASFAVTREGWYLPRRHVARPRRDGNGFRRGRRTLRRHALSVGRQELSLGIDCSGLVQVSLNAAGTGCPRDSDMQQDGFGRALDAAETKQLQRGDLIFWKGHVAIVRDAETIVHANAHHMATVIENTRRSDRADQGGGQRSDGDQAAVGHSLPPRHCERAERRSDPSIRYAVLWIASLRSQ